MPKTQVNSATGIMGVTGAGKSSLALTLAKHLWRNWKKTLLYYTCDGGGFPAAVQEGQALGIIRVFRMLTRDPGGLDLSFETCYRACQGWWPRKINPATGEVPPGVEMVPPVMVRFSMHCTQGHLLKSVPNEGMLTPTMCPTCKRIINKQEMLVQKTVQPTPGFEQVGGVFYDGLTSMLSWEMRELGQRAGRLELKGEEAAIGGKVISGDLRFGGTTRSHVGFAQTRGEELVHLTLGIPNLVVPPVFTMLTHEDVDERSLSILGPKIAGRAKTDEAPQWFGNMLEAAKIPAQTGTGEQRVLYLSEFTDGRGVRHLCKHRGAPGTMPPMLLDPPDTDEHPEGAFTQFNLGVFFTMLDLALDQGIAKAREEFPDAPGVVDGWQEIGGEVITQPPAPVPVQAGPPTLGGANPGTATPTPPPQPVAAAAPAAPTAPQVAVKPRAAAARKPAAAKAPTAPPAVAPAPAAPEPVSQAAEAPAPVAEAPTPAPTPAPAAPAAPQAQAARPGIASPAGSRPVPRAATPVARQAPAAAPRPPAAAPKPPTTGQ